MILPGSNRASLEMHFEAENEGTERYTWRQWLSEFGDELGGEDWVNSEIHSEAVIELVCRCNWKPGSSELRDTLWGCHRASLEIKLGTKIEWTQRCTGRLWSREIGHALGRRDQVTSEMESEAVIQRVWRCTCERWSSEVGGVLGGSRFGGRRDCSRDSIHWLTCNCGNVDSWVQQHLPRDEKRTGSRWQSILRWCCTWCMLYLVWTHDYGMER